MAISSALGSSALLPAGLGFRNLIINGDARIDQRGSASSAVTNTAATDNYFVDRWHIYGTLASKMTGTQVTVASLSGTVPSDPFQMTMKVTSAASTFTPATSAAYGVRQYVEGQNITNLGWGTTNAKPLTLSFWVRSSYTGTYNVSIFNNANDRSYVLSYTINAADTWEKKVLYFPGETTGTWLMTTGTGLKVWWDLGSGSDFNTTAGAWNSGLKVNTSSQANWVGQNAATFYLTGVQLEQNSQPTPYEQRQMGAELALCQRYYFRKTVSSGIAYATFGNGSTGTGNFFCTFHMPVSMRAAPTVFETSAASTWYLEVPTSSGNPSSIAYTYRATPECFQIVLGKSGVTAGEAGQLLQNNADTAYVGVSAELA